MAISNAAILLAGGKSSRMAAAVEDKILMPLAGVPAICHSVNAFLASGIIEHFVIVYRDNEQRSLISAALQAHCGPAGQSPGWIEGGQERQDSVFNALMELSLLVDYVFIHDCARPAILPISIQRLARAVQLDKAAVLAHRVTDTIKEIHTGTGELRRCSLKTLNRSLLWAMETPQAFERERITDAYRRLRFDDIRVTDDTAAAAYTETPITLLENAEPNPKLTVPADIPYLAYLLEKRANEPGGQAS